MDTIERIKALEDELAKLKHDYLMLRPDDTNLTKMVDEIMNEFDFEKVHQVMEFLGWTWYKGNGLNAVPTIEEIKKTTKKHLIDAYEAAVRNKTTYIIDTGGFEAKAYYNDDTNCIDELKLTFVLEYWRSELGEG